MTSWPITVRHHWIVLFRKLSLSMWVLFGVLALIGIVGGLAAWIPFLLVAAALLALRWQEWKLELIDIDPKAIARASGTPETRTSNAVLRIDRISGLRMTQSVTGKLLGYATVHLEAPGSHPDFTTLINIEHPREVFGLLQTLILGDDHPEPHQAGPDRPGTDPSDGPQGRHSFEARDRDASQATTPLPGEPGQRWFAAAQSPGPEHAGLTIRLDPPPSY